MDPLSIISGAASLAATTLKGIQRYNSFADASSKLDMTIASLGAYCSCVDFALLRIKDIAAIYSQAPLAPKPPSRSTDCSAAYKACRLIFDILRTNLEDMLENEPESIDPLSADHEVMYKPKVQDVESVLRRLDGLSETLDALFTSLETQYKSRSSGTLKSRYAPSGGPTTLELPQCRDQSLTTPPTTLDRDTAAVFDFDNEILVTSTYQRAYQISRQRKYKSMNPSCRDLSASELWRIEALYGPLNKSRNCSGSGLDECWSTRSRQSISSGGQSFSIPSTANITALASLSTPSSSTNFPTDGWHAFLDEGEYNTPTVRQASFALSDHAPFALSDDALFKSSSKLLSPTKVQVQDGVADDVELQVLIERAKRANADLKTKVQALESRKSDQKVCSTSNPFLKSITRTNVEVCSARPHHSYVAELCFD